MNLYGTSGDHCQGFKDMHYNTTAKDKVGVN